MEAVLGMGNGGGAGEREDAQRGVEARVFTRLVSSGTVKHGRLGSTRVWFSRSDGSERQVAEESTFHTQVLTHTANDGWDQNRRRDFTA